MTVPTDWAGRPFYYRFDAERRAIPATRDEMVTLFDSPDSRRVALDDVDDARVSTVFLVIDHGFADQPVLFETMVFGGRHDQAQWRYATWDEARQGHDRIVTALREGLDPEVVS